jgi:ribulose 1,5-bisphosphate synthetase/thiazole synthase
MTKVDDVVINWTPVGALPRAITCVDPVAIESKLVIDATGHDAVVVNCLVERGLVDIRGFGGIWVSRSEDALVEHTGEVYPGCLLLECLWLPCTDFPEWGPRLAGC